MSEFEEGKRKELGLPSKREILDQGLMKDKINPENFDYSNPYVGKTYNPQTKEYVSKFDIIKNSVDTPEEYREQFLDYDLQDLKKEQVRKNPKDGKFYNGWGEEKKNANDNVKIRKKVAQVFRKAGIKDLREVDRVMFAKDWDSYKVKRDNIKKPFESKLDNVVNQRTPSETSFDNVDEIIKSSREFRENYLDKKINEALSVQLTPQVTPVVPQVKPEGITTLTVKPREIPKRSGGLAYILGVSDD
tara:strand:- start:853 stop:1590 length:738 start_codon:yes stop_codon:yes gene_type:complete